MDRSLPRGISPGRKIRRMAMKETEGSLRAYFVLAGAVAVLLALGDYGVVSKLSLLPLTAVQKAALCIPIFTRIMLGVGFVVAGLKLKSALQTDTTWIKKLLVASGAMLFINGALITAAFGTGQGGIIGAVIGVAITVYLYRSVERLTADAKAKAGIAPPPPQAKVV